MTKNTNTAACVKMKEEKDEASILSIVIIIMLEIVTAVSSTMTDSFLF